MKLCIRDSSIVGLYVVVLKCVRYAQVTGNTSGSVLGRDLEALIERARGHQKKLGDSFVSVEHLVLSYLNDSRFGQNLFKEFKLSANSLKAAIEGIRGPQKVTDQGNSLIPDLQTISPVLHLCPFFTSSPLPDQVSCIGPASPLLNCSC